MTSRSASTSPASRTGNRSPNGRQGQSHPIVVGLDGRDHDPDALALATALRTAFEPELILVHVVPEAPLGRGMAEFEALEMRDGIRLLAKAAAAVAEPVETELIKPWPVPLALERVAFTRHASLIVLGSTHRNALGRIVPGAAAMHLLKGAPCPVAVAPVGYGKAPDARIDPVAVAYDGTMAADHALRSAASVAARLSVPLHIYHAVSADQVDDAERAQRVVLGESMLARARERLPASAAVSTRLLSGEPGTAILAAALDDGIGLLFAGSRGHGSMREELFGGVCRSLLRGSRCPLVLIPHNMKAAEVKSAPVADRAD